LAYGILVSVDKLSRFDDDHPITQKDQLIENVRTNERTNERTNKRTKERKKERKKERNFRFRKKEVTSYDPDSLSYILTNTNTQK
jgi:hypothetical protein